MLATSKRAFATSRASEKLPSGSPRGRLVLREPQLMMHCMLADWTYYVSTCSPNRRLEGGDDDEIQELQMYMLC